jgi:hypothetical protein
MALQAGTDALLFSRHVVYVHTTVRDLHNVVTAFPICGTGKA